MNWTTQPSTSVDYTTAPLAILLTLKQADLSPSDYIIVRDRVLLAWQESQKALAIAKDTEMQLRVAAVKIVSDPDKTKGTENVALGNGYFAKAVKKETVTFVKNGEGKIDRPAIERVLTEIENTVDGGRTIAERLIKWDPTLSMTEYNLLDQSVRKLVDSILVTTAGTPTLEIKPPKAAI